MNRALILGSGYTGKFLKELLLQEGFELSETHRSPGESHLQFDLNQSSTWFNLPQVDFTFWTFPCEPLDQLKSFMSQCRLQLGRVVCIGSTSAYVVGSEVESVSENSPVDLKQPRVEGEAFMQTQGAIVVRAAGIYGPNRDPRQWVEAGRVGRSEKLVNFIHVKDLARILLAAARRGKAGQVYLAADGRPSSWSQLIDSWVEEFGIAVPETSTPSKRSSKRIDSSMTLNELKLSLLFPDVTSGVRSLR